MKQSQDFGSVILGIGDRFYSEKRTRSVAIGVRMAAVEKQKLPSVTSGEYNFDQKSVET
jgi:predicted alternative tryptophan synthase beta-subunit